ncbi:metallophosphoesterase family protein [Kineothrix sp. IPX-CK]|uniref:Metallophosphoesterase family protein n=1 Tax=Kineothrix sedimenti TaxID=3123317 RepID=A0ABZ3F462_9FIRM
MEFEGHPPFLICHGSPYQVNEKMIPNSDRIFEILEASETGLIICGHTHRQNKTIYNKKTALNPGSVGMPLLSEGRTQFLILSSHERGWQEEFISLEYEVDEVIADMRKDKLMVHAPYWSHVAERVLRNGRISNTQVLDRAMALCKEAVGECVWPHISEKYWEQAIRELYAE